MPCPRQITEEFEKQILSPFATMSTATRGREIFEPECDIRTCFQRDRDRIIHSRSFRRLKHKTQVFLAPESDHYRTRLTHTLEVAQISRTVARALRLNEDLTEAVALAHDLGHTPFGHAGERALNDIFPDGFTHYEQGVRVCRVLEKSGKGLNLTAEVLDGILHHTRDNWSYTPEGRIVRICDKIAYMNHDTDDAIRGGILTENDLPINIVNTLGGKKSKRIDTMVRSLIENSTNRDICFSAEVDKAFNEFHSFLYSTVYVNEKAKGEERKVAGMIGYLYEHYKSNPHLMPEEFIKVMENDGTDRAVTDYIAGMTDHFLVTQFSETYIPKFWNL